MSDQSIAREDSQNGPTPSLQARVSGWLNQLLGSASTTGTGRDGDAARGERESDPAGSGSDGEELLSDEERIVRQLRQAGRMRQSDLVARLGWSKTKVSRRLTAMEEADQVCRLRIGREKIVALPDDGFEVTPRSDAGDESPGSGRA